MSKRLYYPTHFSSWAALRAKGSPLWSCLLPWSFALHHLPLLPLSAGSPKWWQPVSHATSCCWRTLRDSAARVQYPKKDRTLKQAFSSKTLILSRFDTGEDLISKHQYGISASIPLSSIRNLVTIPFHLRDGFLQHLLQLTCFRKRPVGQNHSYCFLFASITHLSMYVQQRNLQKWMFRLGCPSKVKEGIETIVPIKDQQQTSTPPFFWTFAGWAASNSLPPEFWWIPFSKAWYTEVEASREAVNVATWLRLWAGCLALAEWSVPNRWPVTSCKRSMQYTAWANVQPLLLHHATRIVMWHWSSNYQYHQIPTDCAMLSTGRKSLVASIHKPGGCTWPHCAQRLEWAKCPEETRLFNYSVQEMGLCTMLKRCNPGVLKWKSLPTSLNSPKPLCEKIHCGSLTENRMKCCKPLAFHPVLKLS